MSKNILKVVPKINRKRIKYASKNDILENKFENAEGPIDTYMGKVAVRTTTRFL